MDRPSENLLSRLEQSLRQSRAARMHLAARLRELEAEADSVRAELAEMDTLPAKRRPLFIDCFRQCSLRVTSRWDCRPTAELEAAMRQSPAGARPQTAPSKGDNRFRQSEQRGSSERSVHGSHHPSGRYAVASRRRWGTCTSTNSTIACSRAASSSLVRIPPSASPFHLIAIRAFAKSLQELSIS